MFIEWIDSGNNKKAIQEAERVLKKQPDLLCAKVLKGLALLRLGKKDDSEEIINSVRKEGPVDDSTLQAISMCYRETNRFEKVCEMYEEAIVKEPYNEDLHTNLFMSYVRISDFKKQQQSALNLYKHVPKNPYYFWAVMSVVMQAQNADETVAQKVILPLAERMIKKLICNGKIEAEQEIVLYTMILDMESKYEESLRVIDGELGTSPHTPRPVLELKRAALLKKLNMWEELNTYMKKLITNEPDYYNYFEYYIESVFVLKDKKSCDEIITTLQKDIIMLDKPDNDVAPCFKFINSVIKYNKKRKVRGPYIGQLLLYEKLINVGQDAEHILACSAADMITTYFHEFGEKSCCLPDMYQFLPLVKNPDALLSNTWSILKLEHGAVPGSRRQLLMFFTHFQFMLYFGKIEKLSTEVKIAEAANLLKYYINGLQYNLDLTGTDVGFSDTSMVMLAHVLYDVYMETNNLGVIRDAVSMLEFANAHTPANYHVKLLIVKFYNLIGATGAALKCYETLDVKHVQYDSLTYLVLGSLLQTGRYRLTKHIIENILKFYGQNYKETSDQLTFAYKFGSFEKVIDVLNFRERLKNSYHHLLVKTEKLLLDLLLSSSHESTLRVMGRSILQPSKDWLNELNNLCDNRDTGIIMSFYSNNRRMTQNYMQMCYDHDILLLKIRMLMLRCLGACLNIELSYHLPKLNGTVEDEVIEHADILNGDLADGPDVHLSTLTKLITDLKDIHKTLLIDMPEEIPKTVFTGVEHSRLFTYLSSPYVLSAFIDTMTFAHMFLTHCTAGNMSAEHVEEKANGVIKKIEEMIQLCNKKIEFESKTKKYGTQVDFLRTLSQTTEMISVISMTCGILFASLKQSRLINSIIPVRRKKKKGGKEITPVTISPITHEPVDESKNNISVKIYRHFVTVMKDNIKSLFSNLVNLEGAWKDMDNQSPTIKLNGVEANNLCEGMSENRWHNLSNNTTERIINNFKSSIKEIRDIISEKVIYLSHLQI